MNLYRNTRKCKFAVLKKKKEKKEKRREVEKLSHAHNKYENVKSRKCAYYIRIWNFKHVIFSDNTIIKEQL